MPLIIFFSACVREGGGGGGGVSWTWNNNSKPNDIDIVTNFFVLVYILHLRGRSSHGENIVRRSSFFFNRWDCLHPPALLANTGKYSTCHWGRRRRLREVAIWAVIANVGARDEGRANYKELTCSFSKNAGTIYFLCLEVGLGVEYGLRGILADFFIK
jgi:hypothetical protein